MDALNAKTAIFVCFAATLAVMPACSGIQSALAPASDEATDLAHLFWWMAGGGAAIWALVMGLATYGLLRGHHQHARSTSLMIIGGGVVFPTLLLFILLCYGLALLPNLTRAAPADALRIEVVGEQWWWRIRYHPTTGKPVDVANEIHLPLGEEVAFELSSADVIHSFWVPALGGKIDMIPGRKTRLTLRPTKTGVFRGVCAEYCGSSHALMSFMVVVEERPAFEAWLLRQQRPAVPPSSEIEKKGAQLTLAHGCGSCHAIRGTEADGALGPDLTHVGSRLTLAAGTLTTDLAAFHRWLAHPDQIKPDALMPRFDMLPQDELQVIAAYLAGLQ